MRALIDPAVALMNRLSYPRKYAVMGLMMMLVALTLLFHLYSSLNAIVVSTRTEIQGLERIRDTQGLIRALQIHRGASTAELSGNASLASVRSARERDADQLFARLDSALGSTELGRSQLWVRSKDAWRSLQSGWRQTSPAENLKRHSALIADLLEYQVSVADAYGLMLDPDSGSYYLIDTLVNKVPVVLERLGLCRARGTAVLARKAIDENQKVEFAALLADVEAQMRLYRYGMSKVAQSPEGALLSAKADVFNTSVNATVRLMREDILGARFSTDPKRYFELTSELIDTGYNQIFEQMIPATEALLQTRLASVLRTLWSDVALVALLFAAVLWLGVGAYASMTRQIREFAKTAQSMAGGDLSVRVASRTRDEMSDLVRDFNVMADGFSSLIERVRESAERVNLAAQQMSQSSAAIAEASQQEADSASSMAASVEQMTVGISHISASANEAGSIAQESGSLSERGAAEASEVVGETRSVAEAVRQTATMVGELGEQSKAISVIAATIRSIAEQTNLLALNAAIEAARAGEQGRGFAVVADEVRKLAERTALATQEISTTTETIQLQTRSAVEAMKLSVARVEAGLVLTERAGGSMQSIHRGAQSVRQAVEDISSALGEQSGAATELARRVEDIARVAEETSASVGRNAVTAQHLESLAKDLQQEIAHFRV